MRAKLDVGNELLMPKATAVWLVENTGVTFEQIADVTGLHPIEVQALADEEVGRGIVGRNPIDHGELKQEEIVKAESDTTYKMQLSKNDLPSVKRRAKGPKYVPVSRRGDKPNAISYLLKHHPELSDAQVCKLIGTTKPTINSVRDRTHPNSANITPRHPVDLELCSYSELEKLSSKALKAQGKDDDEIAAQQKKAMADQEDASNTDSQESTEGFDFSNFLKTEPASSDSPDDQQ